MFEVPQWDDTPSNNISFTAVSLKVKNKGKKTNTIKKPKQPGLKIPKFKAKSKLNIIKGLPKPKPNKINKTKKFKHSNKASQNICIQSDSNKEKICKDLQNNKKCSDDDIDIINYDTDKQDELILEIKKQRFDILKNNDIEESLFQESPEDTKNDSKHVKISDNEAKISDNVKDLKKNSVKGNDETVLNKNKDNKLTSTKKRAKVQTHNNYDNHECPLQKQKHPRKITDKDILPENTIKLKKNVKVKDQIADPIDSKNISNGKTNVNSSGNKHSIRDVCKKSKLRIKSQIKIQLQKDSNRSNINVNGNKLRERMLERLKAAKFRYLNEKLYTSSGTDAQQLFKADPTAFQTYHEGYQQQVKKWPVKPLDIIVSRIQKMPKTHKIADMGCGEAELSRRVVQSVRSFDLVATVPEVEACDMAHTPMLSSSMDVAVYCLALMGTELTQYLVEANRVLKIGGHLLIAEVESRFQNVEHFTRDVQKLGFSHKKTDSTHKVFYFMEFTKTREAPVKKGKLPVLTLKPCIYKKR